MATTDWRKPWMKGLSAYPFSTRWTMTRETFNQHRAADRKMPPFETQVRAYAEALGISLDAAHKRVSAHYA